jgi:glycosyltransferase involved in cell wall biosynthesis
VRTLKNEHHITVCICTFKRPELLARLLSELENQETKGLFNYSIVVVDNDKAESGRLTASSFAGRSKIPIQYLVEPNQGIAHARNRAISSVEGDLVAFIDDDEFPKHDWLLNLFNALFEFECDGVLGPVIPHFDVAPPAWVVRGRFFDRPSHDTGFVLPWHHTRTGNVLFKMEIIPETDHVFNPDFTTGEDKDFFRRMIEKGCKFVWCNEAPAYEVVPPGRWELKFLLKRALMRGKNSVNHGVGGFKGVMKTISAVIIYTALLPIFFLFGKHMFISYLVKDFDHIGRLLTLMNIEVIGDQYIVE